MALRSLLLTCAFVSASSFVTTSISSSRASLPTYLVPVQYFFPQTNKVETSLRLTSEPREEDDRGRSNIVIIQNHEDYVRFLEDNGDSLLCIKYYASWCKSCAKFGIHYRKLARDEADQNIRFAEVEYTQNTKLCKTLKVKKLPTVHMYRKGKGKISDMTCRPSQFQDVIDEVHRLLENPEESSLPEYTPVDMDRLEAELNQNNAYNDEKTETSLFEQTMTAGGKLAEEIMPEMTKEKKQGKVKVNDESKEKSWFPFTF